MVPREPMRQRVAKAVRQALAATPGANYEDHNADATISLPIRGSDKCTMNGRPNEAGCLPFSAYMAACERIRREHPEVRNIILTSEDPAYFHEWPAWANGTLGKYEWRFILNSDDVHQGTGGNIGGKFSDSLFRRQKLTPSDILLSMLSSFYLQMHSRFLVLSPHSNWHRLIHTVAAYGCSTSTKLELIMMKQAALRRLG
eukprot:CAMPEP_0174728360 /NCGR_PEP_ID=MMETSP1094-20130205/51595_1 /TAXON_ID=156173 /ORGANISM="Chrysochromulina brevifilum, Strain UTEX LB 985" /LENGTH=199 /DNA_ID=CAMNT_0015930259 /DNA_START=12 /DNA_END=611 /DNA_ORIENTATION=+